MRTLVLALSVFATAALALDKTQPASSPASPQVSTQTPAEPLAGQKSLTLIITGDNRGEIAPCG